MGDGNALSKFFSWQLAAWSAFLLNLGAWLRVRNERLRDRETANENQHDRLLAELDRAITDRDYWHAKYIEQDEVIDKLQSECLEHQGARVIAEARLSVYDQAAGKPTILPGIAERKFIEGNGK